MLRETVEGIVRLSFLTEETTESIGGESVLGTTFSVNVSNVDLDRGVVLGSDETVGGRANKEVTFRKRRVLSSGIKQKKIFTTCEECKDR